MLLTDSEIEVEFITRPFDVLEAVGRRPRVILKVLLVRSEIDLNRRYENRTTLLYRMARNGDVNSTEALLGTGRVDIEARDNLEGETPLCAAAGAGQEGTTRCLLKCGASVVTATETNRTAVSYAAEMGHPDVLKLLIGWSAMSDIPDALGMTPLLYARCGNGAVVDILLSEGARTDFRDMSCKTALQWATSKGIGMSLICYVIELLGPR